MPDARCAVYVHLPFCISRCGYCDFETTATAQIPFNEYIAALLSDWEKTVALIDARTGGSIYFGGGTPSLWPVDRLVSILRPIQAVSDDFVEITVEINPRDADERWFGAIAAAGFNRVSVGVQAMDDRRLKWLGRTHDTGQARRAVALARSAGIANVSVDFIYGTPAHTLQNIEDELGMLTALEPAHVSAYELTVSSRCRIGRAEAACRLPDEDARADMWWKVRDCLTGAGFCGYEVSNYAPTGRESRHNRHYWRGGCYIGLGAGAHGHVCTAEGRVRYGNTPDVTQYIADARRARNNAPGISATLDTVTDTALARELLMLGLRTSDGVNLKRIAALAPTRFPLWRTAFDRWQAGGFVQMSGDVMVPAPSGMLMADGLSEDCF